MLPSMLRQTEPPFLIFSSAAIVSLRLRVAIAKDSDSELIQHKSF